MRPLDLFFENAKTRLVIIQLSRTDTPELALILFQFHFLTGPASGDCTFEHGSCHWNNTAVSDMPWYLREGKTGSVNTGPSVDHTQGTSSGTVPELVFHAVTLF